MEGHKKIKDAIYGLLLLSDDEWKAFADKLTINSYLKGEFLTREGQVENHIYFLNKGSTRNYFTKDSQELTVDFHFESEFVTAYYSFITREPSAVFIEALEDVETVSISHASLNDFYSSYPIGEKIGRLMAESQYLKRLRKEMDLLSLTAEERYAGLMAKKPEIINNISVKHLATYLGIQPESLSRIRKQFGRN